MVNFSVSYVRKENALSLFLNTVYIDENRNMIAKLAGVILIREVSKSCVVIASCGRVNLCNVVVSGTRVTDWRSCICHQSVHFLDNWQHITYDVCLH